MKSVEEIERDAVLKLMDEKQEQILVASMKKGAVCSDFVEEWCRCQKIRTEIESKPI